MRTTRIALALALVVSPAISSAQTPVTCTGTGTPSSCNITRNATTTITNLLQLKLLDNTAIDLQANTNAAYDSTYLANSGVQGTPGAAVGDASKLRTAASSDSLEVRANRPYILTIDANADLFSFTPDGTYNVCRPGGTCTPAAGLTGKDVGDLYWKTTSASGFSQITGPTLATPGTIRDQSANGERWGTKVTFKSAWFYTTDIPGVYTATIRYTLTGQ